MKNKLRELRAAREWSQADLADKLGVSRQTINELLRERRAITPAMALKLSRLFGNTAQFWLNAQMSFDLWHAAKSSKSKLQRIQPLHAA